MAWKSDMAKKLSGARIAFIGIRDIRKNAIIQIAFVSTTDGANRTGSALAENARTVGEVGMTDKEFMTHIITEVCDYAVENDMEPDDTLSVIADNIKAILEISTFNGWKKAVKLDD